MAPYHVSRAREQLGVFSQEEVLAKLNRGELLPGDLAWTEGMADWQPLDFAGHITRFERGDADIFGDGFDVHDW